MLPVETLDAQLLRAIRQLLVALEHRLAARALRKRARAIADDVDLAEEASRVIAGDVSGRRSFCCVHAWADANRHPRPDCTVGPSEPSSDGYVPNGQERTGAEAAEPQRSDAAGAGAATNGDPDVDSSSKPAPLEREPLQTLSPEDAMRVDAPTDYEVQQWLARERSGKALRSQQFAKVAEELLERRQREDRDRARADARSKAKREAAHG